MKLYHAMWERENGSEGRVTCETNGEERDGGRGEGDADGGGKGMNESQNRSVKMHNRIRRTVDKTKRTTSSGNIEQAIDNSEQVLSACFTFPETEARSNPIDHMKKACHTQRRVAEPTTVGNNRHTRNFPHMRAERLLREARR